MRPIAPEDVLNLHEYELARQDFRRRVIDTKKRRRVALGPIMTLVFENRETVLFQIQEMLRIERIVRPDKVQQELDVYNELLPGEGEVAATLFIEVTTPELVQPTLDKFVGLDEPGKLALRIGRFTFPARFAAGQSREDRISAVHYVRFPLGEEGRAGLRHHEKAELAVEHGDYVATTVLSPETVEELLSDLGDEGEGRKANGEGR
jgi:hypothetical protein